MLTAAPAPTPTLGNVKAVVTLSWGTSPRDLDLWIRPERSQAVGFSNPGALDAEPWLQLAADVTQGNGSETITIAKPQPGVYRCYVHNYSNETKLAASGAIVSVAWASLQLRLPCPQTGSGRYWHVLNIDGVTGAIEVVGAILDSEPQ